MVLTLTSCQLFRKSVVPYAARPGYRPPQQPGQSATPILSFPTPFSPPAATQLPEPETEIRNVPPVTAEIFYSQQFKYAILLDRPVEEIQDHRFIAFMEYWYGTPYRMGGMDTLGIDCSGFVWQFYNFLYHHNLPRTSQAQFAACKPVDRTTLQQGDLVFFHTQRRKRISHVGVYLVNNKFAHASSRNGVMISDLSEDFYAKTFAGAGTFRN